MSKKKDKLIEDLDNLDPEKDMPLPERLKADNVDSTVSDGSPVEESVEASPSPSEPEIKASETKQVQPQPDVVEPGCFSTKVEASFDIKSREQAHQDKIRR